VKTLSKSDFKAARTCGTKLYYKELGYPTLEDESELLELLADGGYMVEHLAKLLYPEGIALEYAGASEEAARETMRHLEAETVTLFEATLLSGAKLARADILVKLANRFELIEVKAKSYDPAEAPDGQGGALPRNKNGTIPSAWREYVEDVAFQVMVLRELFPDAEIVPYLMLVDKTRSTTIDAMYQLFDLRRERDALDRDRVTVAFTDRDGALARIREGDHFLARVDVAHEVDLVAAEVAREAERFVRSLVPELTRLPPEIGIKCRGCEYRVDPDARPNGFLECWGDRAWPAPHVLDLMQLRAGAIGDYVQARIDAGECALVDLDPARFVKKGGQASEMNLRQRDQVICARENRALVRGELGAALRAFAYPLRFIDFETSALCVPYHAEMRPYETVAFQWSCHTIDVPGGPMRHREWINTDVAFPNFEFARSLLNEIGGGAGSVFMWHPHERTVLSAVARQMDARGERDTALADGLAALIAGLHDQKQLCIEHYLHPGMGGSASIKRVLDAIWRTDPELRAEFAEYAQGGASPYESLPPMVVDGEEMRVAEGAAAMRAYQWMLYGPARHDPEARAALRGLLLRYCKLDTAAMVMIWKHWLRITA